MATLPNEDDASVGTGFTKESSGTLIRLKEYIHDNSPQDEDDDAATVITSMVNPDEEETQGDENSEPQEDTPSITANVSDDGSVDLVYSGLHNVADSASILMPHNGPKSTKSASSMSTTKSNNSRKTKFAPKKFNKDVSLDVVLERLSKQGPEVSMPPKAAWESKVKLLANQIDQERDNGMKLADIELMLTKKKEKAKKDTEQAKWKSRVRDLESLLEERKREKDEKLRKLAIILGDLKKEKAEMKKYEKPGGGSRWASKSHQYMESAPNRPNGPDRSASLVRTVEPGKPFGSRSNKVKRSSNRR